MRLISRTRAVVARRSVLRTLVVRDLRVRYSRSLLGYVWTILDPLLMSLDLLRRLHLHLQGAAASADTPYFLYLLSGLLALAVVLGVAQRHDEEPHPGGQAGPLDQPAPRGLGLRCVLAKGVEFVLSLPVLVGFVIYYLVAAEAHLDWLARAVPARDGAPVPAARGARAVLAPITVLATDMQRVVRIVLRFLFYLSPDPLRQPRRAGAAAAVLVLNPLTGILSLYRAGLVRARPDLVGRRRRQRGRCPSPSSSSGSRLRAARARRPEGDLRR